MKISAVNNLNFKALIGKREIIRNIGNEGYSSRAIFHVYPFEDEFISSDKQEKITKYIKDGKYGGLLIDLYKVKDFDVKFEEHLPFTKDEFEYALESQDPEYASKEALKFIASDKFSTTTAKDTGYVLPEFL